MKGSRCSFPQRFRNQRRKIRPSTNPIPSAVNTAFVGFSRTYCSASSWNVRTRLRASPHACSALPRASPQACSAFPRYSSAKAPAADFKSSAALRACSLLLCNFFLASAVGDDVGCPGLFSSAIGNLQLVCSLRLSACFVKWANAELSLIISLERLQRFFYASTLQCLTCSTIEKTEITVREK